MYPGVPTTAPTMDPLAIVGTIDMLVSDLGPSALANPKSRTFTVPLGVSLMFAGLRSR
jgi:hypothetical protein